MSTPQLQSGLERAAAATPGGAVVTAAASPETTAIRVDALWKRYGTVQAVRGVFFDVRRGEIFGLIGPDGAGKTSTFQVLAGVMEATSGSATVFGKPAREMRAETGYLTQTFSLYPDLTVLENIRYIGELRSVAREEIDKRGLRYLQLFDMDRFGDRLAGRLSGGMKQKLALVCALVPEPHVLLLDEPTTGVDPVSRREFWDALAHLATAGLTIVLATPYLDEAERCDRVALMHEGEIRQIGTPAELRKSLDAKRIEVRAPKLGDAEKVLDELAGNGKAFLDVQRFGDRLDVLARDPDAAKELIGKISGERGLEIGDLRVDEPTLENVFVARLRAVGHEVKNAPFPWRHEHRDLLGQAAIGANQVSKHFGPFTAVNNVSLNVQYGEVYGLLGANGAGKTTLIKLLCGLLESSHGDVQLGGKRGGASLESGRQSIGYMSQKFSLYDDLPVIENLQFFGGVYGVPADELNEKIRWVLDFAGLEGKEKQLTGSLPGGWKQRVAFGAAILHEPKVIFLDEPTSGVDPLARRSFWNMINRLADAGAAILVTTHYLEEAEQCNRLGMMVAGELVAEGSPTGIKSQQHGHLLEVVVDQPQRAADLLKAGGDRWRVSLFGDRLHVLTDSDAQAGARQTQQTLEAEGIRVSSVREIRFSLEDAFISVVEQSRLQGKINREE